MVKEGERAPDFELPSWPEGKPVRLSDFRGKWVVLYFYPKDMTSGCTKEACQFRDLHPQFEKVSAVVLGVSKDSLKSHQKFAEKYNLPFRLLSDENAGVAQAYGVWVEKSMYGRKYMGMERSTFLIDPEGIVRRVWRKVKVDGHADEVLKAIEEERNRR